MPADFKRIFQDIGSSLADAAQVFKKDVGTGARITQLKIAEIRLARARLKKIQVLGFAAFELYKRKGLRNRDLAYLCRQVENLDRTMERHRDAISRLKRRMTLS